jgi:hypothetical protein
MRSPIVVLATVVLGGTVGCATMDVGADFEPSATLAPFHTFRFDTPDALPTGDPRLDNNPFFDTRMRAAVEFEMAAKGLKHDAGGPDLLVHYRTRIHGCHRHTREHRSV